MDNHHMNDHYYKFMVEFIPHEERSILNKNTRYLMGYKKRKKYLSFYMNLCLHSGSTCFRYCVCRVLNEEDVKLYYTIFTASQPQHEM